MRLFGLTITRTKNSITTQPGVVPSVPQNSWLWGSGFGGGWWPIIREPFTGAWQRNLEMRAENVLTYSAVYACVTLIAGDIAKNELELMAEDADGISSEIESPAFSPVLRKPNRYQTQLQFIEQWVTSKLLWGNTYVLKERDGRGVVVALYVLNPALCKPMVAPDGEIFYQVMRDNLLGIEVAEQFVPQSEIIHDRCNPLYHPLWGISPLSACGMAALQGLAMQDNSTRFFANGSHPGGVLSAPGMISDEVAKRIKAQWDDNYTGVNAGKVAVLGDGLKFEKMSINPVDAQIIEQFKWTSNQVCMAFHVPPHMIGLEQQPTRISIEALTQQYYGQCLQIHIESIEWCLTEGLSLPADYCAEFDLANLLRMDTQSKITAFSEGIKGGIYAPNEARAEFDLAPMDGGDEVYLQQQNFSLAALAKRDAQADPFGTSTPAPAAPKAPPNSPPDQAGTNPNAARHLADQLFARSKQIRYRHVA